MVARWSGSCRHYYFDFDAKWLCFEERARETSMLVRELPGEFELKEGLGVDSAFWYIAVVLWPLVTVIVHDEKWAAFALMKINVRWWSLCVKP